MNLVKVKDEKVILMNDRGSIITTIVNHSAINADISNDGKLIVITFKDGKVILYNDRSSIVNTICGHSAISAKFSGDEIAVSMKTGKIELRKQNGSLIRTL